MPPYDPTNEKRIYQMTEMQASWLGEIIESHLDDTEDWNLPTEELQEAVQDWINIARSLHQDEVVDGLIKDYKHICELS